VGAVSPLGPLCLINLERSRERLASFRALNPHLEVERFSAVDGRALDRAALVRDGLITADLGYTPGAIGSALSHQALWERAIATGAPVTVLEDDATLCGNFTVEAVRALARLAPGWDYVQWGWNFDTVMFFEMMPGISRTLALCEQERMRAAIAGFHRTAAETRLYPLTRSLGIPAYTVSPAGAARLLAASRPLQPGDTWFPMMGDRPNTSIDFVMSAAYDRLAAFVAFPPLVLTANDHAVSTNLPP
jgi:glycosyl transferase, family 25